jgi:aryl-alcohol dehydrogenase-like predicted oxidoreductase
MKFSLGTAQFSNNYGVLKKKTDPEKIFRFINSENSINFIDTAPGYINSEKLIGKFKHKVDWINLLLNNKNITHRNIYKIII